MTHRVFRHRDDHWEVIPSGFRVGAGSGRYIPEADRESVTFRCVSDPQKGEVKGYLRAATPSEWSEKEVQRALTRALANKGR